MGGDSSRRPIRIEVITYVPTWFQHCQHCEVTWQVMGLGGKVHREQLDAGLPDDLYEEFHRLSAWARALPGKFGTWVDVRLVDAASIEGFFKSLVRRFRRYPAFTVDGERYVGSDFSRVDALVSARLAAWSAPP